MSKGIKMAGFTHFTEEELQTLVAALEEMPLGDIYLMCLYCGMNIADIMAITAESIDFEAGVITLRLVQMEHQKYIDVKPRRQDRYYLMTEKARPILAEKLVNYQHHKGQMEYETNNPWGFLFALDSGEMPDAKLIQQLSIVTQRLSGLKEATSKRLIRHYQFEHGNDFMVEGE